MHQVHAQNDAPIFNWQGEVQVSPSTLTIREGEALSYNIRLSEQPAADGCWVRIHVDGVVYIDGRLEEKGISWVPSVGWEFNREEGKEDSDPTQWRSVRIEALQDDEDDEDEFVTITHEVWDENGNCPLHGVAPVEVQVTGDETVTVSGTTSSGLTVTDTELRLTDDKTSYADLSLVGADSRAHSVLLGWRLQFGPNIRLQFEVDLGDRSYGRFLARGLMGRPGPRLGNPGLQQ